MPFSNPPLSQTKHDFPFNDPQLTSLTSSNYDAEEITTGKTIAQTHMKKPLILDVCLQEHHTEPNTFFVRKKKDSGQCCIGKQPQSRGYLHQKVSDLWYSPVTAVW